MHLERKAEMTKDRAEPNTHALDMGSPFFYTFFRLELTFLYYFLLVSGVSIVVRQLCNL